MKKFSHMITIECQNRLAKVDVANGEVLLMQNGVLPWSDAIYKILSHPPYLKGSFFIQQPYVISRKGMEVSIVVTGKVKIYVAIPPYIQDFQRTGGFEISLPKSGWKKETGKIAVDTGYDLSEIYSKYYGTYTEQTISLPPITTEKTNMIITVVSICSGNNKVFMLESRYAGVNILLEFRWVTLYNFMRSLN